MAAVLAPCAYKRERCLRQSCSLKTRTARVARAPASKMPLLVMSKISRAEAEALASASHLSAEL